MVTVATPSTTYRANGREFQREKITRAQEALICLFMAKESLGCSWYRLERLLDVKGNATVYKWRKGLSVPSEAYRNKLLMLVSRALAEAKGVELQLDGLTLTTSQAEKKAQKAKKGPVRWKYKGKTWEEQIRESEERLKREQEEAEYEFANDQS